MGESVSSGLWSDEQVERAAQTLYRLDGNGDGEHGLWTTDHADEHYRKLARAVLGSVSVVHGDKQQEEEASSGEEIAAFFQEALDETEGMELPHAYHFLRVKVASRISALTADLTSGEREGSPSQKKKEKGVPRG